MKLKVLVGSGDKIGRLALPFFIVGAALNVIFPAVFRVGGPSRALKAVSFILLVPGVTVWIWSVILVLRKVPRGELITTGPYALMKHPIYAGVALLVLPWAGFLLNTWLGALLGAVFYLGSRMYAPEEEKSLAATFGPAWNEYAAKVKMPWL